MGNYTLVVTSAAKPGREDDYNSWYDEHHLREVCDIPGVVSGRRLDAVAQSPAPTPAPYLAIYEIEIDDPMKVMAELGRRIQGGEMKMTDAIDGPSAKMWLYKAHG